MKFGRPKAEKMMARIAAIALSALSFGTVAALADQPVDGGVYFQQPATEIKADIIAFHDILLWIITAITVFVLGLLLWVIVRYNRAANPEPRRFTHNVTVEVIWTAVPVVILIVISAMSFPLLAKEERVPQADMTIKAIGATWNWTTEYPDHGDISVVSNMLQTREEADAAGKPYLLGVDSPVVVPVDTTVRVLVTSNDVIHSWAMPAFGVKEDAIPGRVNEGWFHAEREGVFYGQCSELCGIRHAFMPIEVRVVSKEAFAAWVAEQGGTMPGAAEAAAPAAPTAPTPADPTLPAATDAPAAAPAATPAAPTPAAPAAP